MKPNFRPILIMLISMVMLTACANTTTKTPPANDTKDIKKSDDRGFDPCLLNAKLAVCTDNENTNRK